MPSEAPKTWSAQKRDRRTFDRITTARVGHALGPAPLAFDEDHARRVADLELYVRQHHAERDLAQLGSAVLSAAAGYQV